MVLDFTHTGEVQVKMGGYTDELLKRSGIVGTARTPGTDGLFEVRDTALPVPEEVRVWFHRTVAMILYLAKRARPEVLTALSYLATRLTKSDSDDVDKLIRLIRYIRGTREMGMILRPGASGIRVHLFVDASYARGWALSHGKLRCDRRPRSVPFVQTADSDQKLDRGGARWAVGLSEPGPFSAELSYTTGVQHASSHSVPRQYELYGSTSQRPIGRGAHMPHSDPIFLDEGSRRQRRGNHRAQGDSGRVDQAAAGEPVRIRERVPNRVAHGSGGEERSSATGEERAVKGD